MRNCTHALEYVVTLGGTVLANELTNQYIYVPKDFQLEYIDHTCSWSMKVVKQAVVHMQTTVKHLNCCIPTMHFLYGIVFN